MIVNGYNVTGNHAAVGREYHLENAAGEALHAVNNRAIARGLARSLPPGDVPEPQRPSPEPAPVALPVPPEPLKDGEPLPSRWPPKPKLDIATAVEPVQLKAKPKKKTAKRKRKAGK